MPKSLNIGLLAYAITPELVFVRVPNERGRWMLTDRCVVEVDCPYCKAVAGEPCRSKWKRVRGPGPGFGQWESAPPSEIHYVAGVHTDRREQCKKETGFRAYKSRLPPHKLRLSAADLIEAQTTAPSTPEGD